MLKSVTNLNNNNTKNSRRTFLKKSLATGASLAVASTMATTASASPKRGGTLRIGLAAGSSTDVFDPRTFAHSMHTTMGRSVWNQLVQVASDGTLMPELATSWEQSADGLEWTIHLRKGVTFSNGQAFTSADVVYSLKIHADKKSKSGAYGYLSSWETIKADGKHAVKIKIKAPNQDLPWILNDYHLMMMPDGFTDWANPIGTGGYILTKFKAGERVEFKRRDDYWKPNSAWFDTVVLLSIKDNTARQNALLSKQVDVISDVSPKTAKLLERRSNVDLVLSTTGKYVCNNMNTSIAPFADNNVRLAIKHSIDREQFVKNILGGYGDIGNDNPIARGDEFYNPNLEQYKPDYDKAKYYLKKAGLSSLKFNISVSDAAYNGATDGAVLISEDLKKSGIQANVVREPSDGYWSNVWMKKPFVSSYWGRSPTASLTFSRTYHSKASWNDTFYKNDRLDSLLATLNKSADRNIRKESAWEMQKIIHDDGGQLIPAMPQNIDAKSSRLKGHDPHPIYDLNDLRLPEKGWFA